MRTVAVSVCPPAGSSEQPCLQNIHARRDKAKGSGHKSGEKITWRFLGANRPQHGAGGPVWLKPHWFRGWDRECLCSAILTLTSIPAGMGSLVSGHAVGIESELRARPESSTPMEYQVKAAFLF